MHYFSGRDTPRGGTTNIISYSLHDVFFAFSIFSPMNIYIIQCDRGSTPNCKSEVAGAQDPGINGWCAQNTFYFAPPHLSTPPSLGAKSKSSRRPKHSHTNIATQPASNPTVYHLRPGNTGTAGTYYTYACSRKSVRRAFIKS